MKLVDIIIFAAILAYCAFVVYKTYFDKSSNCSGTCAGCSSAALCHIDFNQIYREIKEDENNG